MLNNIRAQASQCVGRIIRSKRDYGIMVFADKRCVVIVICICVCALLYLSCVIVM